jgi:hypothetical protein
LVQIKWVVAKPREEAIWRNGHGLYTTQHIKASLANQQKTIRFIEGAWGLDFEQLLETAGA